VDAFADLEAISGVSEDEMVMALQNVLNLSPAEEVMYAHEIRARKAEERGRKLGMELGEKRGKLEGKLELVSKLLTQRFGALPTLMTDIRIRLIEMLAKQR
jgi:hypothetical protein